MAGVESEMLAVKRYNVIAATINKSTLFEYIIIITIDFLHIGFKDATSGLQILKNYL